MKFKVEKYSGSFWSMPGKWFVSVAGGYLHSDGVTRQTCIGDNHKPTGWYRTREDARKAVRLAKGK